MENIKTKKVKKINKKTLIVGVNFGKIENVGVCRCPDGSETKPFEFINNGRGFNEFWGVICRFKEKKGMEEIIVGFESTGAYTEPFVHYLMKRGIRLVQVNPMHTKRLKELTDNSPQKSDRKDPRVIIDIIELRHALTVVIPEGIEAELRRLTQSRERSVERRTALFNQIQELVFIIFPEFFQVIKSIKTKSAQYLLKYYPTQQSIIECGVETLTGIVKKVSRGKLGKECAYRLYEAAKNSVGVNEGKTSILFEIKEILFLIEACNQFIDEVEEGMSNYLEQIPYSHCILSLKGIGKVTAAGIIGEVGNFSKFNTISEIEKLAGLDLFEISSGKHKGERHISKRGRSLLRKILFFASLNVVRKGGVLHEEYQELIKNGKPRMKALIAISRKLLRIIFALVRNHSEYIENYIETQELKVAA